MLALTHRSALQTCASGAASVAATPPRLFAGVTPCATLSAVASWTRTQCWAGLRYLGMCCSVDPISTVLHASTMSSTTLGSCSTARRSTTPTCLGDICSTWASSLLPAPAPCVPAANVPVGCGATTSDPCSMLSCLRPESKDSACFCVFAVGPCAAGSFASACSPAPATEALIPIARCAAGLCPTSCVREPVCLCAPHPTPTPSHGARSRSTSRRSSLSCTAWACDARLSQKSCRFASASASAAASATAHAAARSQAAIAVAVSSRDETSCMKGWPRAWCLSRSRRRAALELDRLKQWVAMCSGASNRSAARFPSNVGA